MGNCCKTCPLYHKPRRNITLLVVGLDGSGKTTMAKRLAGEPVDSVLKTLGFSLVVLRYHSYQISLYDLGGSAQIRDIWCNYFTDAHGIIYVVDSSDLNRLEECKTTFADLLSNEKVSEKPVLLLANKQDKENSLDELEVVEQLGIEGVVNRYRCLTRVELCSALSLEKNKIDIGIRSGFRWLVDNIINNYQLLNDRVQRDMTELALRVEQDRNEWKARMEEKKDETCEDVPVENGNPFRPIDQVIKKINGRVSPRVKVRNGTVLKNVLIDNYVREESPSGNPDLISRIGSDNIPDFTVKTDLAKSKISVCKNIDAIKRPYTKHKRKFARFNKTAPMPIDVLIQDNSNESKRREVSKYSVKSEFTFGARGNELENRPKNYLTRRPATAPSKFNLPTIKVNTAWDLSTPIDVSVTSNSRIPAVFCGQQSSPKEDVISYF